METWVLVFYLTGASEPVAKIPYPTERDCKAVASPPANYVSTCVQIGRRRDEYSIMRSK
jgi:hypothetical protein